MEKRTGRTVTMNWDELDDFNADDDEFFESTNRLSVVVPLDMPIPDDNAIQQVDDSRVSFSYNLASNSIKEPQNAMLSMGQYDMWMVAPGSITDRRRRLLQGMGLNSNKDFASLNNNMKLSKVYTKRLDSIKPVVTPMDIVESNEKMNVKDSLVKESSPSLEEPRQAEPEPQPEPGLQSCDETKAQSQAQGDAEVDADGVPKHQHQPQPEPEQKAQLVLVPEPEPKLPEPKHEQQHPHVHVQVQAQAQVLSVPTLLVRSRSDSDIETSSFNTKRRKEDMIGSTSKQRLTRTSSELVTPSVGLSCQYANVLRVYTPNTKLPKRSVTSTTISKINNDSRATSSSQLDSFFLIKNLDTGKEFVVKEFNDEGMWKKVSDLQTGKQLTMDEFDNTVGHSPVVKELMRRASRKRNEGVNGKLAMTNSYLSKSFRYSKKKGASFLKNLRGSMSISKTEKEKKEKAEKQKEKTKEKTQKEKEKTKEKEKDESVPTATAATATATATTTAATATPATTAATASLSSQTSGQHKASVEHITSNDKNTSSEWVKAKAYGKPLKEFSALHLCQKIEAHDGSIWTMRFSSDGQYLASGGEDKVIHVWEVQECDVHSMRSGDDKGGLGTPDNRPPLPDGSTADKKKKSKNNKKKPDVPEYVRVPESMFGLSEKPVCTFSGHQDDVLDLSWSRSKMLLSSSMDKTVRLWDIETKNCLKQFAHSDYVTCIQFNPADDDYFISGSLDKKVRVWSIPSRKVVNWNDLSDMITAVGYYPDGQGAIVGLHNGNCKSYCTADSKLELKDQIELHTKVKVDPKKITSFQFSPLNPSEVVITSADSRIRIIDGTHVVEKLIGYKNTSSQFSAHYSADGKYVICASEDSQVFIWKHEKPKNSGGAKPKYVTTTSYEHFICADVTVAVPWHGSSNKHQGQDNEPQPKCDSKRAGPLSADNNVQAKKSSQLPPVPKKGTNEESEQPSNTDIESDDGSLLLGAGATPNNNANSTAWGLVIVTAGLDGDIRVYQNVGLPVKVGNLF